MAVIEFRTLGTLDLRDTEGHQLHSLLAQPKRLALLAYPIFASLVRVGSTAVIRCSDYSGLTLTKHTHAHRCEMRCTCCGTRLARLC